MNPFEELQMVLDREFREIIEFLRANGFNVIYYDNTDFRIGIQVGRRLGSGIMIGNLSQNEEREQKIWVNGSNVPYCIPDILAAVRREHAKCWEEEAQYRRYNRNKCKRENRVRNTQLRRLVKLRRRAAAAKKKQRGQLRRKIKITLTAIAANPRKLSMREENRRWARKASKTKRQM